MDNKNDLSSPKMTATDWLRQAQRDARKDPVYAANGGYYTVDDENYLDDTWIDASGEPDRSEDAGPGPDTYRPARDDFTSVAARERDANLSDAQRQDHQSYLAAENAQEAFEARMRGPWVRSDRRAEDALVSGYQGGINTPDWYGNLESQRGIGSLFNRLTKPNTDLSPKQQVAAQRMNVLDGVSQLVEYSTPSLLKGGLEWLGNRIGDPYRPRGFGLEKVGEDGPCIPGVPGRECPPVYAANGGLAEDARASGYHGGIQGDGSVSGYSGGYESRDDNESSPPYLEGGIGSLPLMLSPLSSPETMVTKQPFGRSYLDLVNNFGMNVGDVGQVNFQTSAEKLSPYGVGNLGASATFIPKNPVAPLSSISFNKEDGQPLQTNFEIGKDNPDGSPSYFYRGSNDGRITSDEVALSGYPPSGISSLGVNYRIMKDSSTGDAEEDASFTAAVPFGDVPVDFGYNRYARQSQPPITTVGVGTPYGNLREQTQQDSPTVRQGNVDLPFSMKDVYGNVRGRAENVEGSGTDLSADADISYTPYPGLTLRADGNWDNPRGGSSAVGFGGDVNQYFPGGSFGAGVSADNLFNTSGTDLSADANISYTPPTFPGLTLMGKGTWDNPRGGSSAVGLGGQLDQKIPGGYLSAYLRGDNILKPENRFLKAGLKFYRPF